MQPNTSTQNNHQLQNLRAKDHSVLHHPKKHYNGQTCLPRITSPSTTRKTIKRFAESMTPELWSGPMPPNTSTHSNQQLPNLPAGDHIVLHDPKETKTVCGINDPKTSQWSDATHPPKTMNNSQTCPRRITSRFTARTNIKTGCGIKLTQTPEWADATERIHPKQSTTSNLALRGSHRAPRPE